MYYFLKRKRTNKLDDKMNWGIHLKKSLSFLINLGKPYAVHKQVANWNGVPSPLFEPVVFNLYL